MTSNQKVIILLGQRVRSGTNFIGVTLHQHPDVISVPPNHSLGEMNLFSDDSIKLIFKQMTKSFGTGLRDEDFPEFMRNYGELWIKFLNKKYNFPENKTIFIKSPIINYLDLWSLAFPDSQIALLCRDGRDNVISSIKASNDKRGWHSTSTKVRKKGNYFMGRYFLNHIKDWKRTAKLFLEIEEGARIKKFRYEDLNNSEDNIAKLLDFYKLKIDSSILKECLNAPVVGSSFGVDKDGIVKPNWQPDVNKEKFVFSGKWDKWNLIQKSLFKKIAGKELIKLGYSTDDNW